MSSCLRASTARGRGPATGACLGGCEYRTLSADELVFVLQSHWSKLSLTLSADDFTDTEAVAAVARITGGNFRLVQRLFAQIQRIMEINKLGTVTREVVETARESLVIGSL